jgi:hypothetical protein
LSFFSPYDIRRRRTTVNARAEQTKRNDKTTKMRTNLGLGCGGSSAFLEKRVGVDPHPKLVEVKLAILVEIKCLTTVRKHIRNGAN